MSLPNSKLCGTVSIFKHLIRSVTEEYKSSRDAKIREAGVEVGHDVRAEEPVKEVAINQTVNYYLRPCCSVDNDVVRSLSSRTVWVSH